MTVMDSQGEFPSQNRPDSEKDEKYVLEYIKAIHKQWCGYPNQSYHDNGGAISGTWNIYASPWEMGKLRAFSRALNNGNANRKAHQLNDADANGAQTAMKIHWDPSMEQWKPMNVIYQALALRDTKLTAYAIDRDSVDARTAERYARLARVHRANDPQVKELNSMMGVDTGMPANEPQTVEELDIHESMGPKDEQTVTLTQAVALMRNKTRYFSRVRTRIAEELRDTGIAVVFTKVASSGLPVSSVVRIEDAVLPWCEDGRFEEMPWCGIIEFMLPGEVIAEVGSAWGKQERDALYELAKTSCTDGRTYGNNGTFLTYRRTGRVAVFRGWFKDTNKFPLSQRKGRSGKTVYKVGEADGKRWKTERTDYEVIYKGNWVIGTHDGPDGPTGKNRCLYWGCGLAMDMVRMRDEPYTTRLPITVRAYNMTDMRNTSIAKIAMIKCIEIEELYIKLRDMIRKSIPPGLGPYNVQALLRSMDGLSVPGVTMVTHLIEMFSQTGSVPFMERDLDDEDGSLSRTTTPLFSPHGGFIGEVERFSNQIDWHKNELFQTLGLNDASLGNTAETRTPVGALKIQMQGSSAALGFLFECFDRIEEQVALQEYGMLQCSMLAGYELSGWVGSAGLSKMFGAPAEKYLVFAAPNDPGQVGIQVRQQMTDEQKMQLNESLDISIRALQINGVDKYFVMQAEDFGLAIQLLNARIKFNETKKHQQQLELMKAQGESQTQAAQIAMQTEQQKLVATAETEAGLADRKHQSVMELQMLKGRQEENKILMQAQASMQANQEQLMMMMQQVLEKTASMERINDSTNASKERIAEGNNETKMEVAEEASEAKKEETGGED